ncbi:MAG: excinuclease ABC subunit UvrB [Candidatus Gracilibacteria bacterium]|nr:excinuclease ABC subunit UvrB [Candidatus Gracilibacteria bacterium]
MKEKLFKLKSKYSPSPDQQNAITSITKYINDGHKYQTLWGVTGSGKTFSMANIIQEINKPTLIIAHNKTLAAQLAQEFKEFFPDNSVHYFVSYYDYYQPEAYVAKTDTYIEKEATINEEIDRLRHAATQDLLTRKDVVIVASVSCIYGIGDIDLYTEQVFSIEVGKEYKMEDLLKKLVAIQYRRASTDFKPGMVMVMGDVLEIFPSSSETVLTIEFWGDEVSQITSRNYLTGEIYEYLQDVTIFPAKHTVTTKDRIEEIIPEIKKELDERLAYFKEIGDVLKYERLKTKVEYDLEMMQEVGYVNGIENYSRYLDGRGGGNAPATLIDYFGDDFLCLVDESHMTFSQIGGMYAGDRARKTNLVENGFRLPSAMDNRPLKFDEFEAKMKNVVAVSATPGKFEIGASSDNPEKFFDFDPVVDGIWQASENCRIVPQMMRPTGLLDPEIIQRPMEFMIDDIMKNISEVVEKNERILITTITKRSSEELTDYLLENGVKVKYLHSEIETLERLETLKELREGKIDVIVGVNLLREGLDLPEVSKICILDADKQGFLRSTSSLIQIIGRAARNENGKVYMYSEHLKKIVFNPPHLPKIIDKNKEIELQREFDGLYRLDQGKLVNDDGLVVSEAMRKAIHLTYYRRNLQDKYNKENGITPKTVFSEIKDMGLKSNKTKRDYSILDKKDIGKEIARLELEMDIAAANMEYEKAAELRDAILDLKKGKKR